MPDEKQDELDTSVNRLCLWCEEEITYAAGVWQHVTPKGLDPSCRTKAEPSNVIIKVIMPVDPDVKTDEDKNHAKLLVGKLVKEWDEGRELQQIMDDNVVEFRMLPMYMWQDVAEALTLYAQENPHD